MESFLFYLGLATLSSHELDAVMRAEWRLLYLLRSMHEDTAYAIFVALHVPLFYLFFWLSNHDQPTVQRAFRLSLAAFMVIHALLHFRLSEAEAYAFEGWLGNGLIYLSAACGLAYLMLAARARR